MTVGEDEDLDKELKELEDDVNGKIEKSEDKKEEEFPFAHKDDFDEDKILKELENE